MLLPTSFLGNAKVHEPRPSPKVEHYLLLNHALTKQLNEKDHLLAKALDK